VERNPMMWAVSKSDLKSITNLSLVSTSLFSLATFITGFVVNVYLAHTYATASAVTVQAETLYDARWILIAITAVLFVLGGVSYIAKESIIEQFKQESKQIQK